MTSARRAEELSALLKRRGATVTCAAAIAMVPLPDDDELRQHTQALIDAPPDIVIATTGIGLRGWIAAADGWGLANELTHALGKARIVSRGPKATGALRAAGLPEEWSPESESSREVVHYLVDGGIKDLRIAVQLHGATDGLGSVSRVPRRTTGGRRRSGAHPGLPLASRATQRRLRPAGGGHRRAKVRRGQLHVGTRRGGGAHARRRDGHRESGARRRCATRARDVRGTGDRPAAGAARRADVGAGADAAGSAGPPHHRRIAAAAGTRREGGRPRAGDPRHLRAGRRRGQGDVPGGDGDHPCAGPPSRRGGLAHATCFARFRAAAPTRTRSRRPCCGCERRWATRRSCRPWSNGVTGCPSTSPAYAA